MLKKMRLPIVGMLFGLVLAGLAQFGNPFNLGLCTA